MAKGSTRTQPNIYEVARTAGVSIATVSRVQGGTAPVAAATRRRVLQAIEDLDYRPSRLGRALAMGRHGATGIVFPDLSGPYYSEVILGYEEQAAAEGHSVLILGTHGRQRSTELVRDLAGKVDGLLIMAQTVDDGLVRAVRDDGLPVVLLARPPVASCPSVSTDDRPSAVELASHLFDHGFGELAFIGDPSRTPDVAQRWRGLLEACERSGRAEPSAPVESGFREPDGYEAAGEVLGSGRPPRALMCANDEIAIGALAYLKAQGLRVPGDVAVTGWDDIPLARHTDPPLTTVRQPMRELGEQACRLLADAIAGRSSAAANVVLPTRFITRRSCGCTETEGGDRQ